MNRLAASSILNSLLEAQSRSFRGGLAELFILSGAFKRPPLAVEESPSFRKEFFKESFFLSSVAGIS